jgi:Na+-transporting methylmalonyl-CoA/oxaloacetate decarboxylase gamma subunit
MWLAADDLATSTSGVTTIVIAAISAISAIVVTLLRRRPSEREPDEVREKAATAADAGVQAATSAMATVLVDKDTQIREKNSELREKDIEIRRLDRLLDEAYQAGFRPRPRPGEAPSD